MSTEVQIKGAIMSWPFLFSARQQEDSDPKFQVNILMKKGHPAIPILEQAVQTELQNTFPNGLPHGMKIALKDCDSTDPTTGQRLYDQNLSGYMELRTNTAEDMPPQVCKAVMNGNIVQGVDFNFDRTLVYSGALADFNVTIKGYNNVGKGVGAYINGVMIYGVEGELGRIDNRKSAEQMFVGGEAAAAPTTAPPAAPQQPAPPPAAPQQPAPPPAAPQHQMTETAKGVTYEQYREAGWTDEQLIQHGFMLPPGGAPLAFTK